MSATGVIACLLLCGYLVHLFFSTSVLTNIDQAGSYLQTILTDDFNEEY